ncbi:hypothetical protein [Helicobacter sp. T3_23-1059]
MILCSWRYLSLQAVLMASRGNLQPCHIEGFSPKYLKRNTTRDISLTLNMTM